MGKVALNGVGHAFRHCDSLNAVLGSFSLEWEWMGSFKEYSGKGGFEFRVVLPFLIRNYCNFIIISRCGHSFVVVLKTKKRALI